ncbi:hypothetical protein SAMN05216374_0954 [Tardiphaga sp. OK246]|uniref:hypothetical protein n=1 Tax=Tardiphaga sp. OK246 TaxID=1855307 RepID=UPI000B6A7AAC|nr:hypothetical protein [Tardiphaga sp. OK246]SNS35594.1 hypothetical protein SAMN05216374_0954 [Tardiphaga sp. OK246]
MRDIDIINKAMEDARAVLHTYIRPGPRGPQFVLQRMLEILDHEDVVAAQERLQKGYGELRLVK